MPPADWVEIAIAAKPGAVAPKRTEMAPEAAGLGLGTAEPPESHEKSCTALVVQVVIYFVRQEKLNCIGFSLQSTRQHTHEASFYMDPLPSHIFSTPVRLETKVLQYQAKYC